MQTKMAAVSPKSFIHGQRDVFAESPMLMRKIQQMTSANIPLLCCCGDAAVIGGKNNNDNVN